jgi:predicted outer membrane repeat protein
MNMFFRSANKQMVRWLPWLLPLVCLGGCPKPDDGGNGQTVVSLVVTATPAEGGSVAISPQRASYYAGDTVTLTATPSAGYRFDHWAGAASGSSNPLTLTLSADTAIQAVFVEQNTSEAELSDAVTVLPNAVQVTHLGEGQLQLTGSGLPAVGPGQVLVNRADGILGRVQSVSMQSGTMVVQTTPACLTDVVKKARIAIRTSRNTAALRQAASIRPGPFVRAASMSIENGVATLDLSGTELEIEDACKITLDSGSFQFDPDFDFALDIDDFKITHFKLAAAGTLRLNMGVQAEILKTAGLLEKEITLAEAEFLRGVVMLGPVPLEYAFFANIKLGAEAECGELGTIAAGVDVTAGVQAGAEYADGHWTPIGRFDFDVNPHVPTMDIWPARVQVYAEPEVGVKFYEVVGPSISFKDYIQLQSDYRHEHLGAELQKGSEIALNFEFSVPKIDFAKLSYSQSLYDSSYVMLARLAFAADPVHLGTIGWSPAGWGGSNWFWYIDPITVTGTPATGNRLAAYGIDYLCRETSVMRSGEFALQNEPIDGSKLITAYFVPLEDGADWQGSGNGTATGPYTLTRQVFPADAGSIVVFPSRSGYATGTRLLVEARPNYGSRFHHWEGALSGTEPVQQLTIGTGNVTIRAVFESIVPRLLKVPRDYATIQEALDAATYGDQINLDQGTYSGPGNRDLVFNGKYVTIHGFSPDTTIIDLGGSPSAPHRLAELWDVAGTVTFTNLTVRNGYAGSSKHVGYPSSVGGAIMVGEHSSAYVGFCKFVNCCAPGDGGAIWFDQPYAGSNNRLTVTVSRFDRCSASSDGGAIALRNDTSGNASASINDSTFVSNAATGQGGAIFCPAFRGPVEIRNCTFTTNTAGGNGGAVRIGRITGQGQVRECTFERNQSNAQGGALWCEGNVAGKGGALVVTDCTFTGNSSNGIAGAVVTAPPGTASVSEPLLLENCQFTDNSSKHGGALSLGAATSMRNCTFGQNSASGSAGAAIVAGRAADCTFTDNTAGTSTVGEEGGAVELRPGGVLDTCTFTGNSASLWGGAVWVASRQSYEPVAMVSACEFRNNSAKGGGAIKADSGIIRNCIIANNTAAVYRGGGVAAYHAEIANCSVSENHADQGDGGGLSLNTCTVTGCQVYSNVAGNHGGGVADVGSTISHSSIMDNTAEDGGGLWCHDTNVLACTADGNLPNNCACSSSKDTCCEGW